MNKIIISALTFIAIGCTSQYEEINTNIYGATPEDKKKEGLAYGAPFLQMQQLVIPIGSPTKTTGPGNDLQNTDLISSGNYIGYFGNNNNWNGLNEANWNFNNQNGNRMSYAYENFYSNIFTEWVSIKKLIGDSQDLKDKRVMALANILKIATWLRATDAFGPIVYKNAGKGEIAPSLDSQEEVYRAMLAELDESVQVLDGGTSLLSEYDVIYNGSIPQWIKFANSLMLRIAVRTHFKDKALADTYIRKALQGGVMTAVTDQAKIQNSSKLPLKNSMTPSVHEYNETRMGETIRLYLEGYSDPRIGVYFEKANFRRRGNGYYAIPQAWPFTKESMFAQTSKPKVDDNSPLYWLRTSEVLFLQAEAALYNLGGLTTSEAKSFYEAGVRMSFQENSVSGADTYLNRTTLPLQQNSPVINQVSWLLSTSYDYSIRNNNVSPNWDDANGNEEKCLQKIITQKYLALYPNAMEAWTEYRRTGYPLVMPPMDEDARTRINCPSCFTPERFKYSAIEYGTNSKMQTQVPALLGGEDSGATKLWWVRPNRPQQQP